MVTVNGRDYRSVVFEVNFAVPPCRRGMTVNSCWTSDAPLSYGGFVKSQAKPNPQLLRHTGEAFGGKRGRRCVDYDAIAPRQPCDLISAAVVADAAV